MSIAAMNVDVQGAHSSNGPPAPNAREQVYSVVDHLAGAKMRQALAAAAQPRIEVIEDERPLWERYNHAHLHSYFPLTTAILLGEGELIGKPFSRAAMEDRATRTRVRPAS
jgi:hypothetical protein